MEKKFGVFNTVEELNRAAAGQKAEGDLEALIGLAEENGLDKMDAEDYFEDAADCLCTPLMAAIGKLEQEAKELKLQSQLLDWKNYIVGMLSDSTELCAAVFCPDKKLEAVLAAGLKKASQNRVQVDARIIKAAGLPNNAAYIGMCGRDELHDIVSKYYLGGGA